jgi:hypothetical protein
MLVAERWPSLPERVKAEVMELMRDKTEYAINDHFEKRTR